MSKEMLKFWINKAILFAVILLVGTYIYWSWGKAGSTLANNIFTQAEHFIKGDVADAVVAAPNGVHVYPREWSAQQLGLTGRFKLDPDYEILDATTIQPDERKTTVISTFNVTDGTVETLVRPEKLSFLGFEDNKEIGVEYGIGKDGKTFGVYGRMDLLRTGAVRYGVYGDVDNSGDFKVVGRAFYRF